MAPAAIGVLPVEMEIVAVSKHGDLVPALWATSGRIFIRARGGILVRPRMILFYARHDVVACSLPIRKRDIPVPRDKWTTRSVAGIAVTISRFTTWDPNHHIQSHAVNHVYWGIDCELVEIQVHPTPGLGLYLATSANSGRKSGRGITSAPRRHGIPC